MTGYTRAESFTRAPNRSQRDNASFYEYEARPTEQSRDRGCYMSSDGLRGFRSAHNVGAKKRKVCPSDLFDAYGEWIPLPGEAEEEIPADNFTDADTGEKRKRYLSSEWNGTFWVNTTLTKLGCVYQLGHGGHTCPRPAPTTHNMVVMDTEVIQTVNYRYCGCDKADRANNLEQLMRNGWYPATTVDPETCATFGALETFRTLNVVGNINVHDFVGAMERQTDPCQVETVPDRYKAFGRMSRQYSFLKRMKRAGRAHDNGLLASTQNGECAVLCWTCPHDGKNLPEGWRDVAPEFQFVPLHVLLAMDANFRLKNRLRANERDDPPLADGWGYIVEDAPYKEHLRSYVAEKDVSTCIAFAAPPPEGHSPYDRAAESGIYKRGERYANMDYIAFSAILGITAMFLAISYDIACQWQIHLPERMEKMPEHLQLDLALITLLFALPVWHASAHEESCQNQNSLTYLEGVGRTDGEGIEANVGARADAIEDKIDHHNFEKNIAQGNTLARKLIVAIDERDRQVEAFKEVDRTLRSEVKKEWQAKIDAWRADRSQPNPYLIAGGRDGGPSEAAIRLTLTKDEAEEAATGGAKLHGSSLTILLGCWASAGGGTVYNESSARRAGRVLLAADQQQRVQEMRIAFFSKLGRWRKLQAVYMSAAVRELEEAEDVRDPDLPPPVAEEVKLYLPSGLRQADREEGCRKGLPAMEAKLREGQCRDSISALRSRLHAKRHLLNYRDESVVGQRAATRAYTLMERIGERVDAVSGKYRRARGALIALRGAAACESYRELRPSDVQLDEEREVDAKARKKLGSIGSKYRRQGPALSSKNKTFSWIWTGGGGPGEDETELHESVRVEWSKAKARKERWEEEVELLREEMKRVLRFLRWQLASGLQAYAARQAALHRDIARKFKTAWDMSAATAVRTAIREDTVLMEAMSAFLMVESAVDRRVAGNAVEGAAPGV
ncbi:hypothetical protein C8F04DRAFT_1271538 [Mycena alexandri]|uniref:CxC2-like cysteine cluster KDZ transposase-associated domain-containing protein n=1 Tax=Mycena alexandri TaxID=1745969 RepID=A0AAD6WW37_9AGAR|nr:hypothetical protein C8F04DRAFT_1271538 [Mycena alexandri]